MYEKSNLLYKKMPPSDFYQSAIYFWTQFVPKWRAMFTSYCTGAQLQFKRLTPSPPKPIRTLETTPIRRVPLDNKPLVHTCLYPLA